MKFLRLAMRDIAIPFLSLLLFTFSAGNAAAQAVSGTILGTVTDATGAVVGGAKVTIKNVNTNVTVNTTTNDSGNYTMSQLAPGSYEVTIEKPGFQTVVQQNVTVTVALSTRVDATLQLGQVTQAVTVTEAPPTMQTDRAEVDTTLGGQQITQLPVLNRNFTNLTLLVPGATLNTFQHPPQENPQSSTLVNTNGQEFAGTNYLLDGMNNNDAVLGIVMVNPPIDSVGETSIATSNYEPEYTQAGGAVVRIQTRSGTNQVHGSAFEFLQNNIFEARDPFTQGLHDPGTPAPAHRGIPALRWNQFGGSLGGPIAKDKLFFFGDYQGTIRRLGGSETLRLPTAAERTGDLSDLGTAIYNPNTGSASGAGRVQFPGNVIPSGMISQPVAKFLAALPLPNLTPSNPAAPNYDASQSEQFDTHQFDVRVDHYLTERLRYFARYSFLNATISAPGPLGLYGGTPFTFGGFTVSGASHGRNQNVVASANYDFNPTTLLDVRFGYSRYHVITGPLDSSQQLASQFGFTGLNIPSHPDTFGMPDMNINGSGSFQTGYQCNCPLDEREFIYDGVANLTKVYGNHSFKFGGTYEFAGNLRLPSDQHRAGVYTFSPGVTAGPGGAGGLGLASFLLGLPSQFNRFAQVSTNQEDRQNRMFYYAQDHWRVTNKLTLDVGVRWDTWFPDYSLHAGQGGRYDVTTNIVYIPGVGGVSQNANQQTQWRNISPRLGIAYAFNNKTVVRAGYGRSYYQGTFGWTFNDLAADIYPSIVNQNLPAPSSFQPVFPVTVGPPPVVFPTIPANGQLPLTPGISTPYIPANQKIPYTDQWNFTIEQQLARDLSLSVGYVGNVARHLNGGFDLNAAVPGPGDFNPRRPLFAKYGLTQGIFDKCDCTSSNYNSLQARAQKTFGQTYSLVASYTYSRTLDFGEFGTPTDQYNAQLDYGPAGFMRKHVLTVAHTIALPFGKGRRYLPGMGRMGEALVGGWNLNGIWTYASGLPFSPGLASNASLNADMSLRPDKIGDPLVGISQNRNTWFNPAAYAVPAPFTFGNAGRNSIYGPNLFTADLALDKTFRIAERAGLQFRWEVFNALNRTNLSLPNGNVDTGTAGLITDIASYAPMRNMQLGLHLTW